MMVDAGAGRELARRDRAELVVAVVLVWAGLLAIPVGLGHIGLSWDALNHHFYLGWTAEHPLFDRDFLAASYQSYQYPYLYWPAYKLNELGASGRMAGSLLVSLHVLAVPALWAIARTCIPEPGWYGATMRVGAVLLGFSGQLLLSLMDTTANDGLAAIPFVWAIALAMLAMPGVERPWLTPSRGVALSGLLAGVSVAFKFSNGPLALVLPVLWAFVGQRWPARLGQIASGCACTLTGFALAYGWWGWLLWQKFGNPMYPFYDPWFAVLRGAVGWHP